MMMRVHVRCIEVLAEVYSCAPGTTFVAIAIANATIICKLVNKITSSTLKSVYSCCNKEVTC